MAEEAQNLVQQEMPAEDVITMGDREPRAMTCNRGKVVPFPLHLCRTSRRRPSSVHLLHHSTAEQDQ
ncbi:unnamed protein product [Ranitomeya imitator]|uniref:Uncharacterized protein n=1 Tax=Ranitomeya imitator TaxID=111125 RepID=A0ABN9M6Y4_9NEOB|nr:unnamed protein product [Ranitomeya imitator]